ncbi:hypothetical protein Tco_0810134 [Tanacetum coccineum]
MKHRCAKNSKSLIAYSRLTRMSLLKILRDSRLMTNKKMIGFMNGTKTCHGYTKNHGQTLEYGLNPLQLHIVVSPLIIKMDVRSGLPVVGEKMDTNDHEDDERNELCGDETHKQPVFTIRRLEMIKYSFGDDEEYVAIKENEYDDLTSTSEDACRAYQEMFRIMDEGWMVSIRRPSWKEKEIDIIGEESTFWKFQSVRVLKLQDGCSTRSCSLNLHEESTEQNTRGVSHSNSF